MVPLPRAGSHTVSHGVVRRPRGGAATRQGPVGCIRVAIRPSPLLTGLRDVVLAVRHDRCPKWRFKLAPDLVVQIQPRPAERRDQFRLFECMAIFGEGITKEMFASHRERRGRNYAMFGIKDDEDKADDVDGGWRADPCMFSSRGANDRLAMMVRLADELPALDVIDPRKMFTASCLICGKGLTDPASMARWIGPECAGTASLHTALFTPRAVSA